MAKKKKQTRTKEEKIQAINRYDHMLKPEVVKKINAYLDGDDNEGDEEMAKSYHPRVIYRIDADHYGVGGESEPSEIFSESLTGLHLNADEEDAVFEVGVYRLVEIKHIRVEVKELHHAKK